MYCLRCGHCCKTMSPLTHPEPCPKLSMNGNVAICSIYEYRPTQCRNHDYPSRYCPIGADVLKLDYEGAVSRFQQLELNKTGGGV